MLKPSPSYSWATYLRWMLVTMLVVIASVGAFNAFVDPLGVFGAPRIVGLNANKPHLDHHRELARHKAAQRVCASTGFFGNSRANIGFDPQSPALSAHGLMAFNHAIPGTTATSSYRQFLWLQASGCLPKTIFLGVEFFDFLGGSLARPLPTLENTPPPTLDQRFFAESVISVSGLRDSLATLLLQRSTYPATITDRGFNPLYNYIPEVEQSGHYILFRQRAQENIRNWSRKPLRLHPHENLPSDDEIKVDALLGLAARNQSTTYLIIYPYHAQIRIMIERLGMGELFANWKRLLLALAERHNAQGGKVEVWDFSGIAPETLEGIPNKGDRRTHLKFYWEAGHFKKELGDLMIDRILGKAGNFGTKLTSETIDSWLDKDRQDAKALSSTPSPLLNEVDDVIAHHASK